MDSGQSSFRPAPFSHPASFRKTQRLIVESVRYKQITFILKPCSAHIRSSHRDQLPNKHPAPVHILIIVGIIHQNNVHKDPIFPHQPKKQGIVAHHALFFHHFLRRYFSYRSTASLIASRFSLGTRRGIAHSVDTRDTP